MQNIEILFIDQSTKYRKINRDYRMQMKSLIASTQCLKLGTK